jgi:hypothetical protein
LERGGELGAWRGIWSAPSWWTCADGLRQQGSASRVILVPTAYAVGYDLSPVGLLGAGGGGGLEGAAGDDAGWAFVIRALLVRRARGRRAGEPGKRRRKGVFCETEWLGVIRPWLCALQRQAYPLPCAVLRICCPARHFGPRGAWWLELRRSPSSVPCPTRDRPAVLVNREPLGSQWTPRQLGSSFRLAC